MSKARGGGVALVKLGRQLLGGASLIAMATVSAPALAQQAAQGTGVEANSADQDPADATTRDTDGPTAGDQDQADQEAEGVSSRSPTAGADDADGEIVVTGIRQSLQSSQDIKRNSEVVVDSVTAEDIGALPDRSVTETLQRIPGVSINRFEAGRDPDHFSAEGSGVVVRGLTYVRSELNGRDTFTANNGRGLSFADVPAELLGGVDVFKSPSADMIEGGIAGTVNLRTRVPFDSKGLVLAGSVEGNYTDFADKITPTVSVLASNRFDTSVGEFGILGSFVYSQLKTRADRLQISNFGLRTLFSNGDVVQTPGATALGEVYFPRGAVIGSQQFDRERYGYSAAAQWRSNDRDMIATLQFLRSDAREAWSERVVEIATDNVVSAGDSRAVPGTTLSFDDSGVFDNGVITGPTGWRADQQTSDPRTPAFGLQSNNQARSVDQRFVTTDIGANFKWNVSDDFALNFDYQHVDSKVRNLDATLWTSSYQNVAIDLNGSKLPSVEFRPPQVCVGPARNATDANSCPTPTPTYFGPGHTSFADPYNTFFRNVMDHVEDSEGNEDAFRVDADYNFPDESFLTSVRAGVRFADRANVARFSAYNWGVLSEQWGNGGPVWLNDNVDGITGGTGGQPIGGTEAFAFDDFFQGKAGDPLLGDVRLFYAGDPAQNYQQLIDYAAQIRNEWQAPNPVYNSGGSGWVPVAQRQGVVEGTPFLPGEINPIQERNKAGYLMLRFGTDRGDDGGFNLSGNIGVRYTRTRRRAEGAQVFNRQEFTSETVCTEQRNANASDPTRAISAFCALPATVRAQARAFSNGTIAETTTNLKYDYFLPSLNLRAEVGGGLQFRLAAYKGIAAPEFGLTRNFYNINLSTSDQDLAANGGPIGRFNVGNPFLRPIRSDNVDLTAEWYFDDVGQLSVSGFYKRLKGVLTNGTERQSFTNNGATFDAIVTTPVNSTETGTIKGFELAYQQTYDFLPGFLNGLGLNANYTFVDSSGVSQSTLSETDPDVAAGNTSNVDTSLLPLQGLSRHTFNITPFYEKGPLSLRLSYSWRSRFLLTTRDVIVPFAPIFNESSGQLDGSIFFNLNDNLKFGVQAVNLLNETTKTTQVLNDELLRAPRSFFINDRRFSGVLRFTF